MRDTLKRCLLARSLARSPSVPLCPRACVCGCARACVKRQEEREGERGRVGVSERLSEESQKRARSAPPITPPFARQLIVPISLGPVIPRFANSPTTPPVIGQKHHVPNTGPFQLPSPLPSALIPIHNPSSYPQHIRVTPRHIHVTPVASPLHPRHIRHTPSHPVTSMSSPSHPLSSPSHPRHIPVSPRVPYLRAAAAPLPLEARRLARGPGPLAACSGRAGGGGGTGALAGDGHAGVEIGAGLVSSTCSPNSRPHSFRPRPPRRAPRGRQPEPTGRAGARWQ